MKRTGFVVRALGDYVSYSKAIHAQGQVEKETSSAPCLMRDKLDLVFKREKGVLWVVPG